MSYDVGLYALKKPRDGELGEVWWANMTSNVSGMWCDAGADLRKLSGTKAKRMIRPLRTAIRRMEEDPDYYRTFEPDNGWGSYEGCLDFLKRILAQCEQYPNLYFHSWS